MDTSLLQHESAIQGEDSHETALLRELAQEARVFIEDFPWSPPIEDLYLGFGVGGVIGIFLVRF